MALTWHELEALQQGDEWQAYAACRGSDVDFYPEPDDHDGIAAATRVCAACGVRAACEAAGANEEFGVWGGRPRKPGRGRKPRAFRPTKVRTPAVSPGPQLVCDQCARSFPALERSQAHIAPVCSSCATLVHPGAQASDAPPDTRPRCRSCGTLYPLFDDLCAECDRAAFYAELGQEPPPLTTRRR